MGLLLKNMGPTPEEYRLTPKEFRENESFTPKDFHIFLLYP